MNAGCTHESMTPCLIRLSRACERERGTSDLFHPSADASESSRDSGRNNDLHPERKVHEAFQGKGGPGIVPVCRRASRLNLR
ncbi:hypothetical protein EVAR_12383_1 [Eumeta japonica]|uniref:Uncharacterized protein n=1 Tax=Eumeta variegata TaxID=151549 RepID=A0A4C1TZ49_EUMVA|nr:hypothetical protein EVAR_12383_1 [Eumeta japonica]